jgi:TIR domain
VTDIFFSYSSKDRERVRPVRDALVAQGFEVFWDQEVPPGLLPRDSKRPIALLSCSPRRCSRKTIYPSQ